jgi:flavin-dependent amine oxidoreductase
LVTLNLKKDPSEIVRQGAEFVASLLRNDLRIISANWSRQVHRVFEFTACRRQFSQNPLPSHDWQSDPYSRGAYSYALAESEEPARRLAAPVANTLFFALEATDFSGHKGTVHGAIASGQRAATELLSCGVLGP